VTFDEHGDRLTVALDTVTGSRFTLRMHIPADIADNMRPATLNIAAYNSSGYRAAACHRDIYVAGTDLSALPDTVAPVIEYAVLNHRGFTDGQTVNSEPVLLARVTDDTAINLSTAGIGSTMTLRLASRPQLILFSASRDRRRRRNNNLSPAPAHHRQPHTGTESV
jgi:hypothetical protein